MKTDIILSGVGGQGILSIAAVIGEAALKEGLYMKQAEVHGMSQRGGDVQSNLRLSDEPIASDLIPKGHADLIISLEPMESLRYLPYLKKEGWLVTNSRPFVNIPNYPEIEKVNAELDKLPHKVVLDVEEIAKELDMPKEDVVLALESIVEPVSLYEPVYSDGGDPLTVMDQVRDTKNTEDGWMEHITLQNAFRALNDREKQILSLRFYDGKTQMEVASALGISQAQVSRLEKGAIGAMRKSVSVS